MSCNSTAARPQHTTRNARLGRTIAVQQPIREGKEDEAEPIHNAGPVGPGAGVALARSCSPDVPVSPCAATYSTRRLETSMACSYTYAVPCNRQQVLCTSDFQSDLSLIDPALGIGAMLTKFEEKQRTKHTHKYKDAHQDIDARQRR